MFGLQLNFLHNSWPLKDKVALLGLCRPSMITCWLLKGILSISCYARGEILHIDEKGSVNNIAEDPVMIWSGGESSKDNNFFDILRAQACSGFKCRQFCQIISFAIPHIKFIWWFFGGLIGFARLGLACRCCNRVDLADMQALPHTLHSPILLEFLPLDLVSTKNQDVISTRNSGSCKGELPVVEMGD